MIALSKRQADANLLLKRIEGDGNFKKLLSTGKFDEGSLKDAVAYVASNYGADESHAGEVVNHYLRQVRLKRSAFLSNHKASKFVEQLTNAFNRYLTLHRAESERQEMIRLGNYLVDCLDGKIQHTSNQYNKAHKRWCKLMEKFKMWKGDDGKYDTRAPIEPTKRKVKYDDLRQAQASGGTITIPPTDGNPLGKKVPVTQTEGQPAAEPGQKLTIDATPATTPEQKKEDLAKGVGDANKSRQQQLLDGAKALKISISETAKAMYGIELTDERLDSVVGKAIDLIANLEGEQTAETVKSLLSPLIKT